MATTWSAQQPVDENRSIYLSSLRASDADEFLTMTRASRRLHHPWIYPPQTQNDFRLYLRRLERTDHRSFLIRLRSTHAMAGIINLNDIVWDGQSSASLGYYVALPFAQKGYMRQALEMVKDLAFEQLKLHRLEAYIQPGNLPSRQLLKSLGFGFDAVMADFLFINGSWCDHERWVLPNSHSN